MKKDPDEKKVTRISKVQSETMNSPVKTLRKYKGVGTKRATYVLPAILISQPDLSLFTDLQNLLSFCLESTSSLTRSSGDSGREYFLRSIEKIEVLYTEHKSDFDPESQRVFTEFIDEVHHLRNILRSFPETEFTSPSQHNQPAGIVLTAKASRIQWLAVCLIEELKKPFQNS